jgi:sugar/nucleoside kinase (ribokinase family)
MQSILCAGSIALDTTRTPFATAERVLGGAASYFSYSASFFSPVSLVSIVGNDFPKEHWDFLAKRTGLDLAGVQRSASEKTFFYDSSFGYDLGGRTTNETQLNSLATFNPVVPNSAAENSRFVYLATMPPQKQLAVLKSVKNCGFSAMDTIEFYINTEREALLKTIAAVDCLVLNDAEVRLLTKESNLLKAGKKIWDMGPKVVVIKKGEHGCLLFYHGAVYPFPAFPLEELKDPTGAGDSFAGGFIGYLAKHGVERDGLTPAQLRKAIAYGSVMGSFAVEDFSLKRLAAIDAEDIAERFEQYRSLVQF